MSSAAIDAQLERKMSGRALHNPVAGDGSTDGPLGAGFNTGVNVVPLAAYSTPSRPPPSAPTAGMGSSSPPTSPSPTAGLLPNILLFQPDDLYQGYSTGWQAPNDPGFSLPVAPASLTPNIDRIGSEGATFSAAYTASGMCAPSRLALLSALG